MYVSSGNYGNWLEAKASRLENEKSNEALLAKRLRKELHWLRGGSGATKARKKAVRELQDDSKARSSKLSALKRGEIAIPQVRILIMLVHPHKLCFSPNVRCICHILSLLTLILLLVGSEIGRLCPVGEKYFKAS